MGARLLKSEARKRRRRKNRRDERARGARRRRGEGAQRERVANTECESALDLVWPVCAPARPPTPLYVQAQTDASPPLIPAAAASASAASADLAADLAADLVAAARQQAQPVPPQRPLSLRVRAGHRLSLSLEKRERECQHPTFVAGDASHVVMKTVPWR
eukprot:2271347-Rhodomonas_salina.1